MKWHIECNGTEKKLHYADNTTLLIFITPTIYRFTHTF